MYLFLREAVAAVIFAKPKVKFESPLNNPAQLSVVSILFYLSCATSIMYLKVFKNGICLNSCFKFLNLGTAP